MKYNIFVDMDGVLVDFNKGYYDLTGIDISGKFISDTKFWAPIKKAGCSFWINLEWMKDGKKLWKYVEKYEPQILSAPSKEIESRVGKYEWVQRELPGTILILRSPEHKAEFSTPNSILIDDRLDTIISWREKGGIGIHHTSAKETIIELKKLGI